MNGIYQESETPSRAAVRARKQRQTPRYKEWRAAYEKTAAFRAKKRAYFAGRRANPEINGKITEYARRYRERHRVRNLVRNAVSRSKINGLACDAAALRLWAERTRPDNCPCCGTKMNYAYSGKSHHPLINGPSIDRINCRKGYVIGNVAVICWRCNALKRDATFAELVAIVAYMKAYHVDD